MTIHPDLHPDDTTHRRDLIDQLRALRVDAGMRQVDLASNLHIHRVAVVRFEHHWRLNPFMATVQRYARALGHVAVPVLHGIDGPTTADMRTYAAVAATSPDPDVADAATRSLCITQLSAARRNRGLTRLAAATLMGVSDTTLYQFETERYEQFLATYQRYARALGGRLTVELRPVDAVCGVAA